VAAAPAHAAPAFVSAYGCANVHGGQATVPAGSSVTVRQRIAETRRGVLLAWLTAQSTSLSVNGGPTLDLTGDWSSPGQQSDGSWLTTVDADTGVTLAAGQSLTFAFEITLAHPVPEVVGGGQPGSNPAGSQGVWTCTVTAA
jgi:hypothetical protein